MVRRRQFRHCGILSLSLLFNMLIMPGMEAQSHGNMWPMQLKGLRSILMYAIVDPEIPGYSRIRDDIERRAGKGLIEAGLSLENEQGSVLVVEVACYPVGELEGAQRMLIEICTTLSESVRLLRKPAPHKSIAAITWHEFASSLVSMEDIEAEIQRETDRQINDFIAQMRIVSAKK